MICQACHAQNEAIAKFCEQCGNPMGGSVALPRQPLKKANPKLLAGLLWGGFGISFLGGMLIGVGEVVMGFLLIIPAFLLIIAGAIYLLMFLYRCWSAIQGPQARTTPGKAVGFLFIPFFNLYWVFQAVAGLATDSRSFLSGRSAGRQSPVNDGLSIASSVLWVVGSLGFGVALIAPELAIVWSLVGFVQTIIWTILAFQWGRLLDELV